MTSMSREAPMKSTVREPLHRCPGWHAGGSGCSVGAFVDPTVGMCTRCRAQLRKEEGQHA